MLTKTEYTCHEKTTPKYSGRAALQRRVHHSPSTRALAPAVALFVRIHQAAPSVKFSPLSTLLTLTLLLTTPARAQLTPGTMDVHWNEGAPDCAKNAQSPLQVHSYNAQTFILRENPCSTAEAPFMYLLVGSTKALMIDTG